MKAILFEEFQGPLHVQNVPDPEPSADGAVVRVEATGICRSDWHGWMGHDPDIQLPHVPGHELAGVIEAVGSEVKRWQPGDRVTVPFAVGCGHCPQCLSGNQHICDNYFQPGFTAWGSFAEYVALRYADVNLVALPEEMGFVEAASLGCRFITSFRAVVAQGRTKPGEWVVIHGCGGVGLSAVMIAAAMGAQVIGVDIKPEALALAEALGASHTLNAKEAPHLIEAVQDLTGGGAHVSIDALGIPATCRNSVYSVRKGGQHVQIGMTTKEEAGEITLPTDHMILNEIDLVPSLGMQPPRYDEIFRMVETGTVDPSAVVTETVSLEDISEKLDAMTDFGTVGIPVVDSF